MAEVKWIKITTNMFEDEKIDFIESLPEADAILIIWIKLLTLAGKCNANGFIFLTENIPYTPEMLSHRFRRPLNTVKLALDTLNKLEMVQLSEDGFLKITNWEKHQNIEGMEKIREQNRIRKQRQREKQKLLEQEKSRDCHVTVTHGHAIDIEEDIDIDYIYIVAYLNQKAGTSYRHTTRKTRDLIKARWNEGFRVDDFKKVIDIKVAEWKDNPKMSKFIRPETLFSNKFEGYLNQITVNNKGQSADKPKPFQFD